MKRAGWAVAAALVLLAALAALFHRREGGMVHFELPDGFRGIVEIDVVPGAPEPPHDGARTRLLIPDDGRLAIPNHELLSRLHLQTASWRGGGALPVGGPWSGAPNGKEVKLWGLEADDRGHVYFFVGTEEEVARRPADDDRTPGSVPARRPYKSP